MSEQIDIRSELKLLCQREPFHPFVIRMASGDAYEVTEPFKVAVGDSTVIVLPRQGPGHSILRFNQINAIDVLETAE